MILTVTLLGRSKAAKDRLCPWRGKGGAVGKPAGSPLEHISNPQDHIQIRIPQNMMSGIPLVLGLEPECGILMFMWSLGPYMAVSVD